MASYEELQRTVDDLTFKVEDLLRWAEGLANAGRDEQLGALAFSPSLAEAYVGSQEAVRSNLGLSDASTRNIGEASGDLMEVGAFGLGASSLPGLRSPDSLSPTQFFRALPGDRPDAWNEGWLANQDVGGFIINRGARPHAFFFGNSESFYMSRRDGGGWLAPVEFYHSANILGEVSQTHGIPTGAIIERGSNSNGEYVKFADGTLIMTVTVTTDPTMSAWQSFSLPASSVTECAASLSLISYTDGNNSLSTMTGAISQGFSSSIRIAYRDELSAGEIVVRLLAVGRWF